MRVECVVARSVLDMPLHDLLYAHGFVRLLGVALVSYHLDLAGEVTVDLLARLSDCGTSFL